MPPVHAEKIGAIAVVECESRVVRSDTGYRLRNAVTSLRDVRIVVIDLSEVRVIEDGGLFVLMFLRRWAQDHDIRFKLFNPTKSVRDTLEAANSVPAFDFATLDEMIALLERADPRNAVAA
jgi:anti-anti-sigma regulatory factor